MLFSEAFYWNFFYIWLGLGVLAFVFSLFTKAPYGRHIRGGWGPKISNRWAWFIMETPALFFFLFFFTSGNGPVNSFSWLLAIPYLGHYAYRGLWYPFRLRTQGKQMPFSIALMALVFNLSNGLVLGTWLGQMSELDSSWLSDTRFILGALVFVTGMAINIRSDNYLISLRKPGEKGYKIPRGGLFEKVSCPNHFGEMLEWFGYAIMCWAIPVLGFALWTVLNVLPRSLAHHRWYKEKFEDYPAHRKAVWPGIL